MNQLFDLFTCQLATTCQLRQHLFSIFACLIDHVSALLLGELNFVFHVSCRIGSATLRFKLCLLANSCRIRTGFAHKSLSGFGGPQAHVLGCLTRRSQHPSSFFTKQGGDRRLIKGSRGGHSTRLHRPQFAFQESFALLQPAQLRRHHAQKVAHLFLAEPAPHDLKLGRADCRRGRRIGTRKRDCHANYSTPLLEADCGIREPATPYSCQLIEDLLEVGDGHDTHRWASHHSCLGELV